MVPGPSRSQMSCRAAGSSQDANPLDRAVKPMPASVAQIEPIEPPWIFRRENQLRSFLFWEERENGDGEATQVVYRGI